MSHEFMRAFRITLNKIGLGSLIILFIFSSLNAQQLAFPTAKGAGAHTTGGRGGQVIHVTTLDWDAPGGLREAIQTPGPRIIVFDVSGEIDATSEWDYTPIISGSDYDNITIAGQSAPAGGISIRTSEFMFQNVNNVIIRYIRFRGQASSIQDAFWLTGGSNIIIDHCTFSHGGDESGSLGSSVGIMGNITMQNCFLQDSKTGTILGVDDVDGDFTFVNNVYSSISHRFPNPKGNGQYDIINNIVYNWKYRLIRITGEGTYNVINNYYKTAANGIRLPGWFGDEFISSRFLQKVQTTAYDNPLIYAAGSIVTQQRETPLSDDRDMWSVFAGSHLTENIQVPDQYFTNTAFPLVGQNFSIKTADQAYIDVLNDVGADKTLNANGSIYPFRDDKDAADILMIQNDTYDGSFFDDKSTIPYPVVPENTRPANFDTNNDGMPDVWKIARGFEVDEDLSSYIWPSGYVGVEEYLNEIDLNGIEIIDVTGVEVTPETATINIPDTVSLSATILPSDATNQNGIWSSSDESIATVSQSGIVTPVSEGEVIITFTTNDGDFTDNAIITVTNDIISLESVTVTPEESNLELGNSLQLNTTFNPTNTSDISGIWSSSDESMATVDENGNVTALMVGEVTITFTANDGGFSDSSLITVVDDFFGTYPLYNAETDLVIHDIVGNAEINLEDESHFINFRCIPEGGDDTSAVESVGVTWTGPSNGNWIESDPIYAGLPNGHVGLNFEPYLVEEGTYDFVVTYYSGNGGTGSVVAIDNFSLTFFFDSLPEATAGLDQSICIGETITLTASGGTNYLWENGETTASIDVNPTETTTYSVTISDDNDNSTEASVTITVNEIPIAYVGDDQTICEGETVTLTATGGDSYLWNTGETTASIEVSPITETVYSVEVTSNNCSSTDDITIFVNESPELIISEDIVIVEGESTILTVSGSDNYEWNTGEVTESITVSPLTTETYTVTSIGLNGCITEVSVTVTVIPEIIAEAGEDVTICYGETVTLTATGGSTYLWSTGDSESELVISPTETTTYTVTAEDDYGYTSTDSVTVTVLELPNISAGEDVFIMIGNSATLTASGGIDYTWNTGEITPEITVTPDVTTTYSVVGNSENGCENTSEITVNVVELLEANAGEDTSICIGESITLSASGGTGYIWDTGHEGAFPTVSPTEDTTYTVTVTDDYGNSDTDDVTITVSPIPTAYAGEDQTICYGETVTLTATAMDGDNFLWSTGETTETITVNPIEDTIYTVEVSNDTCSHVDDVQVFVLPIPEIIISDDVVIVIGNSATLEASGGDTYLWDTSETTASINVSPEETTTYSVTSFLANGCQSTAEVTVTVIPEIEANAGADFSICVGQSATLTASGGSTYLWSTGETSETIIVNPTETTTFTLTATDDYGNSDSDDIIITVNELPEITVSDDIQINEGESTTLTVSGSDTYLWNTGETTESIIVSPTETTIFSVSGFSVDGCEITESIEVTVIPEVIANAGIDVEICQGEYVTLNATGGVNYLWSTGENNPSIILNPTETTTYTVVVSDNYGNSDTDSVTVTVNDLPSISVVEEVTILEGETATLGVSGAETYLWDTGETTTSINVSPTESTTYSVTGFSSSGCQVTEEILVVVVSVVFANAGPDVAICLGESVTLTATGSTFYSWNTGETSASITVSPTETTTYTVVVSDEYGNMDTDTVIVTVPDMSTVTVSDDVSILSGESTSLNITGTNTHIWSTGQTISTIIVSPTETTTYTVIGYSVNGCPTEEFQVTVTVIPQLNANAGSDVAVCIGESVTLTASGGPNFLWSTGETSASIIVSPNVTTTYEVEVFDEYGNTDTDSVIVTVSDMSAVTISDNVTIFSGESTSLSITGTNSHIWSTGQTTSTIVVSPTETTTYTVIGYSPYGCPSEELQVTVTVIPQVNADAGEDVSICIGESVVLTATGGDNYLWNTGATGAAQSFTPSETTVYTVTVSDDLGNSDTDIVTVTVNELPVLTISEDIEITEGDSTTLTVSGAETYIWSTGESTDSIIVSPSQTTTYFAIGYSAEGCQSQAVVTVTVVPELTADAGENATICSGESVTLNATGGINYLWDNGLTTASITVTPFETTTYTVTVYDELGNSDSDSVVVIVNDLPEINTSENVTILEGESTTLSVSGAMSYIWNTGETTSTITVSPTETTTYTVVGTSNSCESQPQDITVIVEPIFIASAGFDEHICDNNLSYEVVLTANQGDSYLWSTGETSQSIIVGPLTTTTYNVTITQGEQQDTDSVTVYVDPSPDVVITNGEQVDILNGDFITLTATGANSYEWNNGATQPNIAVSPSETTTYEVRGYVGDCYDEKQVTVNVLNPVIADAGDDVIICTNDVVTLTATGGDDYLWSTGETTPTIEVSPLETTDYHVTVFNALDFDEATVRVEVDLECTTQSNNPNAQDFELDLYPNPALNEVNIKLTGGLEVSNIHFFDVTGKLVHTVQVFNEDLNPSTTTTVDITSFQSGIYFVKFVDKNNGTTKKLIVN
ncbi:Ig-like domain-containing protein [Winogradskyella eckloniae]|uniref:T9SS type A sorting domain-containing protein n=1 Tax=Winogradskyella eckloniae TaxID=1089306 RepID=UPI001564D920|nr:Ig-like domain-containing protein [Winogradskyella eckloniae]NRD20144.1 Ig-like domain-containing protein [Winogradskyella eckloniae]